MNEGSNGVHHTEVDGYRATWCLNRPHLIAIMAVHNNGRLLASFEPGTYPDLVQARELLPKLEKLWDAVRHDFWRHLCPPPHQRCIDPTSPGNTDINAVLGAIRSATRRGSNAGD